MKKTVSNPINKASVTFLQTSKETNGKKTELELTLQPKGEIAMHYHHSYDEIFTAIEGNLGIKTGKNKVIILKPGETFVAKTNTLHGPFNPSDSVIRFAAKVEPGNEKFENFLRISYGLAADGLTNKDSKPKSKKHLAILLVMADINVPGPLKFLFPVIKRIAKKAIAQGEEKRLIDKYCI